MLFFFSMLNEPVLLFQLILNRRDCFGSPSNEEGYKYFCFCLALIAVYFEFNGFVLPIWGRLFKTNDVVS